MIRTAMHSPWLNEEAPSAIPASIAGLGNVVPRFSSARGCWSALRRAGIPGRGIYARRGGQDDTSAPRG